MKKIVLLLWLPTLLLAQPQLAYEENRSLTYAEVVEAYRYFNKAHSNTFFKEYGPTDSGRNLHVFFMTSEALPDEKAVERMLGEKVVVLINNGIHPGESAGIDASIAFIRDILEKGVHENVLFAIVPVYNIGGALNRNSHTRANQVGPEEYGFRGNARNLDLNRDFIKADALNTRSFYGIFHVLKPHIFIDTHTSNGADYQYTMTLISTQKDKLNPALADLLTKEMEPHLYEAMEDSGWEMTPYVNVFGDTPDKGFSAFLETPRYASGFTALFNTIGFITEAHMLKPYKDRVEATRSFLHILSDYANEHHGEIIAAKKAAEAQDAKQFSFNINWEVDSAKVEKRIFKGYEYAYEQSNLGDYKRLKYFRDKPKTYDIDYYGSFKATDSAEVPAFYVVPQAWHEVPMLLQYNGVEMLPLANDTTFEVTSYRISGDFSTKGIFLTLCF